ncbi:hypothetical protein [Arthrobacter sp. OAP107]|uniref:hypothetical protein n=1 Tax=Arthrobacter sp. OAP107 TaxID=3156445 RepID=UPI003393488B
MRSKFLGAVLGLGLLSSSVLAVAPAHAEEHCYTAAPNGSIECYNSDFASAGGVTPTPSSPAARDAAISAIAVKYGLGSALGPVRTGLKNDGAYRQFQRGFVVYSPSTGAQVSRGAIRAAYSKLGYEKGKFGYPVSGEFKSGIAFDNTVYQQYQGGWITWAAPLGAHPISGAIGSRWRAGQGKYGGFNAAQTDEMTGLKDGGAGQRFDGGLIYWSPKTGALAVAGPIASVWLQEGADRSRLGYPVTEQYATPSGGQAQSFQNGVIVQTNREVSILSGAIGTKYFSEGGYTGGLGYPTQRRETTGLRAGGASQSFEKGAIVWSSMTGAQVSKGAIRTAWLKNGAQDGSLGYPTTGEFTTPDGRTMQAFQGGRITWTAASGAEVLPGTPHTTN